MRPVVPDQLRPQIMACPIYIRRCACTSGQCIAIFTRATTGINCILEKPMRLQRKVTIRCLHPMSWGQLMDLSGQFERRACPPTCSIREFENTMSKLVSAPNFCQDISRLARVIHRSVQSSRDSPGSNRLSTVDLAAPDQRSVPRFNSAAEIQDAQSLDRGNALRNVSQRRMRALAPRDVGDSTSRRRSAVDGIGFPYLCWGPP